ncbi:MAG: hypothetical protein ABFS08_00730 [Pseudomonadota bacterium]
MGIFSLLILSCAIGSWSDSAMMGIGVFIVGYIVFTPAGAVVEQKRGSSFGSLLLCAVGVAWLLGSDDE